MITSQLGAAANAAVTSTSPNQSPNTPGAQRDMFMTLLVAQLKNQDPLAPQDSTQFVAQLAQFNSLDQLISIKSALDQLVSASHTTSITNTPANNKSIATSSDILNGVA